jgi:GxxExxY protein
MPVVNPAAVTFRKIVGNENVTVYRKRRDDITCARPASRARGLVANGGQDEQDRHDENYLVHLVNPVKNITAGTMSDELTQKVIGAAFTVHNTLGFGFLESVYEKSLAVELRKLGIVHQLQAPVHVRYQGQIVGDFIADILIEKTLVVELKSVTRLVSAHEIQLVNYLTATGIETGLLINFGPDKVDVRRKFRTYRKKKGQDERD